MSASGDEAGLFAHIRVMIDVILGLGVTTLLRGFAGIVEHPKRFGWSPIHLAWVAWTLVSVLTVWWWEFPPWQFSPGRISARLCEEGLRASAHPNWSPRERLG